MRHHHKGRPFGRSHDQRVALMRGLAKSLILEERISTTEAKARELRPIIEKLITTSRIDSVANRRLVSARLGNDDTVVKKLFAEIAPRYTSRPGGYTRIIKVGNRLGDNADMAMIELVDFNELYNGGKKEVKKAKSRRGGKAKKADETTEAPVAETETTTDSAE